MSFIIDLHIYIAQEKLLNSLMLFPFLQGEVSSFIIQYLSQAASPLQWFELLIFGIVLGSPLSRKQQTHLLASTIQYMLFLYVMYILMYNYRYIHNK